MEKVSSFIGNADGDLLILQEYNGEWAAALAGVLSDYPYRHTIPRPDNFGIAVFSKKEMTAEVISPAGLPPTIRAIVSENGYSWTLFATHPFPPAGQARFQIRNEQLHWLSAQIRNAGSPVVVAGDLNTSSFSPWFSAFTSESGLRDSRLGFGIQPTWPAGFWPAQTTLDHVLVSQEAVVTHRSTGPDIGSDHLPVLVSFRVRMVGE